MTNSDAAVWLRINSMLSEKFKCSCAFDADDSKNLRLLASFIASREQRAEERGVKKEREEWQLKRENRRLRRLASQCGLDAYDAESRIREKRRMRQSVEALNNGHGSVRW
jgi:hypothetical protein